MAAAVVGGAFLSAFIDVVFDRLASPQVTNLILGKKLDPNLLRRLETTLKVVRAVLNDAEKKQISDTDVKSWLDDLKDAVYLADDFLDEVSTKAATQKDVKVNSFFSRLHIFNVQDRDMACELEGIVHRLESILKLKDSLDLKVIATENNLSYRIASTSLLDRSPMYGRDEDKEAVMKLLLDDTGESELVSVVPIVGMGGVGKTTLAQMIYNDDNLKRRFDFQAWVCVSEEFDILKVTKAITEAITRKGCEVNNLDFLHCDLQDKLKENKFLIVLDDVWIEDYDDWNILKKPFQHGIRGSKILITTRSDKVAQVVQTGQAYHLNQLSNEDSWLVFANHACLSSKSNENTVALENIGKEIVRKCKGLPLAAQSLGGMLRSKHDIRDWKNILSSDIWDLSESGSKIIPALRISYHYLPPHLKRCFVYCSLYPKDYEFKKEELILLWMAEDLLAQPKKGKTLEEVGYEYFDDLASRSFFQHSSYWWWNKSFVMHDLMHDLAISLGGEFYFRSEQLGRETEISSKTRHLSFTNCRKTISESFEVPDGLKFLRTLLPIGCNYFSSKNELEARIFSNRKYLRVLSCCGFSNLNVLPNSIGGLIHLRYLNLSRTSTKTLPESLGNLYNLQTLKLYKCYNLTMLPDSMQNLVNLRHLDIQSTALKEMPKGMGKLNQLQRLDYFVVGKHEDNGIKELGNLSNLRGSLSIKKLEDVTNCNEVMEARMMYMKHINSLSLQWSSSYQCVDSQMEIDILCNLQPHQDLELLSIKGYSGTRFPDWVGYSSYHNMKELELSSCNNCCMLPSLGQLPSLKTLRILRLNGLETINANFYMNDDSSSETPFPSLESLQFCEMPYWGVWTSFGSNAFPLLKRLEIKDCPKLKGDLPNHLPALKILRIKNCDQFASSLSSAPAISKLEIVKSNKVTLQELPLSIESITIEGSLMLVESMFNILANTQPTCVQSLTLKDYWSSISFPGGCFPASLKTLRIKNFRKLEFPLQHKHELLCSLSIDKSCDSLTSLPLDTFPNLERLNINHCENLESLFVSVSQSLQNLTYLKIRSCCNFVSFPKDGLPAPNLSRFIISDCNKLKSLPQQMNALLPKLEHLEICCCPEIEWFTEGSMPPNLRVMKIENCEKLVVGLAWPKEGFLPPSLVTLRLYQFSSLETIDCKGLIHLTSLHQLRIQDCPKLENMAGERLPASLKHLYVYRCPLLQQRYPLIWPKISHIPYLYGIP
ncbi:hypothetical protein VNO77_33762 [Canavalia gladiata]|uniref:Disease resistance RPP13-like protein 1 n=1 Tax=Canavalia gladiata TaxID=3824 RepID=A0AAN9KD10_CANGL